MDNSGQQRTTIRGATNISDAAFYSWEICIYFMSLSKQLDMRASSFGVRRTLNSMRVEAEGRVRWGEGQGESEK